MDPFLPCKHLLCKSSVLCVPQYWRRVYSAAPLPAATPPWWQVVTVRGVAWRMRRLLYALSMYERSKEGKKSIVEKGDKKVTVSVGDPKNTPAHCT